jgi:hypothetical protein
MISAILGAMRTPLARPPGRQKVMNRFAPEVCALGVAAIMLLVVYLARHDQEAWFYAAVAGYGLGWILMLMGPIGGAAMALVSEREAGTLDTLLVTPVRHRQLAAGRYWHVTLPWLRFLVYMIPVYLIHAANGGFRVGDSDGMLALSALIAVGPRLYFLGFMGMAAGEAGMPFPWCLTLLLVRWACDCLEVMLVAAAAFMVSARTRRTLHAMVISYLLVLVSMPTVLLIVEWIAALIGFILSLSGVAFGYGGFNPDPTTLIFLYVGGKLLVFALEGILAFVLFRATCRNFDRYMLGPEARA